MKKNPSLHSHRKGFTLIEVMVSVSIFVMVMVVSAGALLSIIDANRKSHTLKSVMDNLNFALESMARNIRVGTAYACNDSLVTPNCLTNGSAIFGYNDVNLGRVVYQFANSGIYKIYTGSTGSQVNERITSPEVVVDSMQFYVDGALSGIADGQPRVIMVLNGHAGTAVKARTDFKLQTSITQRQFDE